MSRDPNNPYAAPDADLSRPVTPITRGASPYFEYQSSGRRAAWTIGFLWLGIGLGLLSIVFLLLQLNLLQRAEAGVEITEREGDINDLRTSLVGLCQVVSQLGIGLGFLMWLHRARKNLPALGWANPKFSPGWSVAYFFIPILNLFRPYQVLRETWIASDPRSGTNGPNGPEYVRPPAVVKRWWAAYLIGSISANIVFRLAMSDANDITSLKDFTYFGIADDVLGIISCSLAIMMIRGIQRRQDDKHVSLAAHALAPL